MTQETMANQSERPAVFIDINDRQAVSGQGGIPKVTRTTWNPNSPAALEAQARLEAQIRQEHEQRLQVEATVEIPLPAQVAQLRNLVRSLVTRIEELEANK
jgi:hypothetical protein